MTTFRVELAVSLKDGLLDPQGKAVEGALPTLGWDNVRDVRVGKYIELTVDAGDQAAALEQVADLAERFLTNPVIESYRVVQAHAVSEQPA
ncbi:MAG: phosphoribosylformylglycinamidine synthase subunit PurS [Actinobacteria bacterium]|nr:phosphoribosylformylglycinamidine synthase subunit PurS [Actinomycetota bacterium]